MVLVLSGPARAQLPAYLKFNHYFPKDGFPNALITDLSQDRQGFLWIATSAGISRFDGHSFRTYRFHAQTSSPDDTRPVFANDDRGFLWLMSQRGLYRYDPDADSLIAIKTPLSVGLIRSDHHLLVDSGRHCLWMSTSRGLFRYDIQTGRTTSTCIRQMYRPFRALLDAQQRLVIAASEGIYVYDPATNKHWFDTIDDDDNEHFISAFTDADGQIWMGRNGRGLIQFDSRTKQVITYSPPASLLRAGFLPIQDITTVPAVTGDSILWLATHDFGLLFFNRRSRQFVGKYTAQPALIQGLIGNQIDRFFHDREGRLWLANQALSQFDPAAQAIHTERMNLPQLNLQTALPNRGHPGRYWLGTTGYGLIDYDRTNHRIVRHWYYPDQLPQGALADPVNHPESYVRDMQYDRQGRLWLSSGKGLICHAPGKQPHLYRLTGKGITIHALVVDGSGDVWASAFERLIRLNPQTGVYQQWQLPAWPGATDFPIPTQFHEQGPLLWVGTTSGVFKISRKTGQVLNRYRDTTGGNPQFSNVIYGITQTADGALWLACHEYGLKRLEPQTGRWQTVTALQREQVHPFSVRLDRHGMLWVMAVDGIHRYDPVSNRLTSFRQQFAFGQNEYFAIPTEDQDGNWFAIQNSQYLTRFDPEQLTGYFAPPRPLVTGFRLFDKPQPLRASRAGDQAIRLRHDQNVITFSFAAPFFRQLATPRLAYKLVGFDADWVEAGTNRQATYTNLDGGDYEFRVRAGNAEGVWHTHVATFPFQVQTPYYRAWWFLAGLALAFVSLVYSVFRYREQQRLRLQQTRDRIARDLHDDMGSYLSSISILSSSAASATLKNPERARQSIHKIGQTARHVMGAMRDIVWSINPDHDSLDHVVERMKEVASELFAETDTFVSFDVDPAALRMQLPLEKRHDFFLIYKEALTNAARYSRATELCVRLLRQRTHLVLILQDNGQGFDMTKPKGRPGGGNGLGNMRKRAATLHASLSVESGLGSGTTICLQVEVA
jgi:ligand-binding sensor domain-containing protein/anti-sigma regulatory factor (Ser/Thr protein kinase)